MPAALATVAAPERADPAVRAALVVAVVAGSAVAVQQRVNGALRDALQDTFSAALVSFGSGLVLVALVVLARPAARRAVPRVRATPLWQRVGGLGGASLVAVGAAATPVVGVALLTVGLVAGQTAGGLLVDRVGLGPSGRHALTGPRAAGALLCLAAVGISVTGRGARSAEPLLLALVCAAGFLVSLQQALNGRLRGATGDASVATLVNFVVGTTALAVGLVVHAAVAGLHLGTWPGLPHWYLYTGGAIGAAFVGMASVVVGTLGVLRLGLATIAGQLLGAVVLDVVVPEPGAVLAPATVLGAALTLVAVGVSGRRARSRA